MLKSQKLQIELSQARETRDTLTAQINHAVSAGDEAKPEDLTALDKANETIKGLEIRFRSAVQKEDEEDREAKLNDKGGDAEQRERIELRSKASLGKFLLAALGGKSVDGPEAELRAAAGLSDGIPIELWDTPQTEQRAGDAATGAPSTVGVNLAPIQPAIFANSIAPRLGIQMPRVASGTYASATISTSLSAAAKEQGSAQESTAAGFTVSSVTPKRVSARLSIQIEDVAAVGQANFESALRENLSLALSDELDKQAITGDGTAPNLAGILKGLTDPTDPGSVVDFDDFVAAFANGVDGLWALTTKDIGIVCGPATYQLSAKTFRDVGTNNGHRGSISFADYAMAHGGGWWTNKRIPAAASNIQQAILYRKGRSIRTAVCPHWGQVSIDDPYTDSAMGTRHFTAHVLLGDVILTQPDAYKQIAFKLA